ncbi:hypothetical protein [Halobiforma nitratireducens]|uniref:Uncharacterized protein n=1 Tax=Halobiforma nitratireducens JCM 10879 TaxID=1227454 RepID=M0LWV8_9EURY|nr:hypothetical protein [Halobiforma nitratireducens]EMA36854.1 hypothetical protein C446_11232 [Halobiforma nitratireducens JCM 10879]
MDVDDDVMAVRIAVRRELNRFFRRLVSLLLATLGILFGLAAMGSPFVLGGGEFLFGAGFLAAVVCSWWFLGATVDSDPVRLTPEENEAGDANEPDGSNGAD